MDKEEDCPQTIIKMAKSAWQKEVGLEFIKVYNELNELKNECKWMKYLIVSVLLAIAVNIVLAIIK